MSLTFILFFWVLHWLISKRSKGLIGEENRNFGNHIRLVILFAFLVLIDALFTYVFAIQFFKHGSKMSDIYIMIGFEVSVILYYN